MTTASVNCERLQLRQLLLDAAAELEGREQACAALVVQKQALQRALAQCRSNLRATLAIRTQP
ncbi:hypothetical protein [Burkholderia seminalis]|uniref:hypothetical protein n=1 Tax=Burkholderia seminalis TaxID=488731 RepID=UPI00265665E8|nr:hypothetical protein [Burkholderia seminalis]MDN7592044.1 hypothetical protein [Burkholderia seminalis]